MKVPISTRFHQVLTFIPILLIALLLTACGDDNSSVKISADTQAKIQAYLDQQVAAGEIPGAVLVIKGKEGKVYTFTSGVKNLETGDPMTADTTFRTGSMGKTFTGMLALQLVDKGLLSLDDTVESLLPGVVTEHYQPELVTVRHLLMHTSGIQNYFANDTFAESYVMDSIKTYQPTELVETANTLPQICTPGQYWSYSNTNYVLLALIAEKLTGLPYKQLVEERLVNMVGLTNTFVPDIGDPYMKGAYADGYINWFNYWGVLEDKLVEHSDIDPSFPWAAGCMIASAPDMADWGISLANGTLLSPELHAQQINAQPINLKPGSTFELEDGSMMGLGLVYESQYDIMGHRGQIAGFDASLQYNVAHDTAFVAIANRSLIAPKNINQILLYNVIHMVFDEYPEYAGDGITTQALDGITTRALDSKSTSRPAAPGLNEYGQLL